jgi:hypothetical protein
MEGKGKRKIWGSHRGADDMTPLDYPEDEARKLLRNGGNYIPIYTTSHIQEKGILQWK